MKQPIPYIGITDFTRPVEVEGMLNSFDTCMPANHERKLHVGVMMSRKTLNGLETKWAKVFPPKEKVADIFFSDETYNCLHYADSESDPDLSKNLCRAISWGGTGIHAVQLDIAWPDLREIMHAIHSSRKKIEVILQIGKKSFDEVGNNVHCFVDKLHEYEGFITRVLLDKSMGRGLGMDAVGLLPYARAIREIFPHLGIGAAGGLGPDTLDLVMPLIQEFPDLSIDAQGKLRPSGDALREPIDWNMAHEYITKALLKYFYPGKMGRISFNA